jgi:quinolinate synthase
MKTITPGALTRALREGRDEVHVDAVTAEKARASVQRMIEIGGPAGASAATGNDQRSGE